MKEKEAGVRHLIRACQTEKQAIRVRAACCGAMSVSQMEAWPAHVMPKVASQRVRELGDVMRDLPRARGYARTCPESCEGTVGSGLMVIPYRSRFRVLPG